MTRVVCVGHVMVDVLAQRPRELAVGSNTPSPITLSDGTHVERVASAPVVALDSTGAGDAFAAGVLAARLSGASVTQALRSGNELAARAVRQRGARP